jgi:hypothetical protein
LGGFLLLVAYLQTEDEQKINGGYYLGVAAGDGSDATKVLPV